MAMDRSDRQTMQAPLMPMVGEAYAVQPGYNQQAAFQPGMQPMAPQGAQYGGHIMGNEHPQSFGNLIYVHRDRKEECFDRGEITLSFYEHFVTITREAPMCCWCYPSAYQKLVVPKFRIQDAQFSRSVAGKRMIYVGWLLILLGIISIPAGGDNHNDGTNYVIGIALLLIGLVLVLLPCCLWKRHFLELKIASAEDTVTGCGKCNLFMAPSCFGGSHHGGTTVDGGRLIISLGRQPDEQFIKGYVYGHLGNSSMSLYHTAAHLVQAGIATPIVGASLPSVSKEHVVQQ